MAAIARALGDRAVLVHADHPAVAPFADIPVPRRTYPAELLGSGIGLMRRVAGLVRGARIVHVTDVLPPAQVAARLMRRRLLVTHHTPELPRRARMVAARLGDAALRRLYVGDRPSA